jgi:hypothetical protein
MIIILSYNYKLIIAKSTWIKLTMAKLTMVKLILIKLTMRKLIKKLNSWWKKQFWLKILN